MTNNNNSGGQWCSTPDKNGRRECIPFKDYLKMTDAQKKQFNRQRGLDGKK